MITDDIALTLQPQLGPKTIAHLLSHFGTAEAVFTAAPGELLSRAQLNPAIASAIAKKEYHRQAEKELEYCRKNAITPIPSTSDLYPRLLAECGDYPHVVYYMGDPALLNARALSVVGTRRMTPYGQRMCDKLVGELAAMFPDLVVVSGLAYGVDAAAHRAALASGIATIGVLPNPLPDWYPAQHARLAEEILARGGGMLSEYHSQTKVKGTNFVPRNRIIAGMSQGTIIVESAEKGGSLITAGMADGYDRSVMAVPGRADDRMSAGTNYLIASQRARMVCSAADVARELMWDAGAEGMQEARPTTLSKDAEGLLSCIPEGGTASIDALAEVTGLSMAELAPLVFELEFEGAIRVLPGKVYERN